MKLWCLQISKMFHESVIKKAFPLLSLLWTTFKSAWYNNCRYKNTWRLLLVVLSFGLLISLLSLYFRTRCLNYITSRAIRYKSVKFSPSLQARYLVRILLSHCCMSTGSEARSRMRVKCVSPFGAKPNKWPYMKYWNESQIDYCRV